jgi:hypothetical protein
MRFCHLHCNYCVAAGFRLGSEGAMSVSSAQAAAARGDQQAASALAMTTNRDTA